MLQATHPMELAALEAFSFPVPFKQVFRHASASRDRAENVIVAARSRHGEVGYGEGCPRRYLTGETVETAARFIVRHREELARKVEDVHALRAWIAGHRDDIDQNPAAFCAVELAILDLAGKLSGRTVEEVLGLPRPRRKLPLLGCPGRRAAAGLLVAVPPLPPGRIPRLQGQAVRPSRSRSAQARRVQVPPGPSRQTRRQQSRHRSGRIHPSHPGA